MRSVLIALLFVIGLTASESVSIDIGDGALHATLEVPASKPPYPVALIIAGSGPTDRDGNSRLLWGKNNSLKMLAVGLAGQGIASLRYDKRGIAESKIAGLKEQDLRLDTYIDDAVRWGQYLRKDPRFQALAVIGHSEGSLIGMVAARKIPADGYVSIAGAGQPGGQIILTQLRSQPIPPDVMKQVEDIVRSLEQGRTVDSIPAGFGALFRRSVPRERAALHDLLVPIRSRERNSQADNARADSSGHHRYSGQRERCEFAGSRETPRPARRD
jgi:uncharacterized protein